MRVLLLTGALALAACQTTVPTQTGIGARVGADAPSRGLSTVTYQGADGCTYQDELHDGVKFRSKRLHC
ncbi:MAG: hypothetical protein ACU0CO_18795 [Shimia sp.]